MHREFYIQKWKKLLADFWTSHLSLAEYCRQHNLSRKTAGRWKIIFQREECQRIDSLSELEIVPVSQSHQETTCEQMNSGVRLEVGELHIELQKDFDLQTLKNVLSLLEVR